MQRLLINGIDAAGQLLGGLHGPTMWALAAIVAGASMTILRVGERRLVRVPVVRSEHMIPQDPPC